MPSLRNFAVIWAVLLSGLSVHAQRFQLTQSTELDPERNKTVVYALTTDSKQFKFKPPSGDSIGTDEGAQKVLIASPDKKRTISFQVVTNDAGTIPTDEAVRARALEYQPGGNIIQVSTCHAQDTTGKFVDIEKTTQDGISITYRYAFIPFDQGSVIFTMSSLTKDFNSHHYSFSNLLNSFHVVTANAVK